MADPKWTPDRRDVLRGALRKVQAAETQRESAKFRGEEAMAIYEAAQAWEDMMTMLDRRYEEGRS